ncbi:MAG: TetR/AcrR family transcriptional regulator [Acidiferrobacteraceae bacterium]|jgi:AcrR family transcriptional regulator
MAGKRETRLYHHGDLRNSLLAAAEKLLREQGAADISLREVAKAAGVSHTAPYRHFQDKSSLLQALAAIGYGRLRDALQDVRANHAAQPDEALLAAGEAYVMLAVDNPEMTQLMFGGVLPREVSEAELMECSDSAFNALLEIVDLGLEQGIYKEKDRMEIALAAWSMVHGLSMLITAGQLAQYASDPKSVRSLARGVGEKLLRGLS